MGKEKIVVSAGDLHNSRIEAIFYITLVITCIQAGYILWDLVSLVPGSDVLLGLEGPNTRTASPYMSALYLIFLGLYAGYKEFRRWVAVGDSWAQVAPRGTLTGFKRGDVFVTFWVALAVMAIVLLQQGIISRLPRGLFLTMVQTVVILLMTYASKDLYIRNAKRRAEDATLMAVHFSAIYSHIERSGSIDNAACRQLCSLDRSRAHRLLQALEKEGLLRGAGQGDARMYTKSSVAG